MCVDEVCRALPLERERDGACAFADKGFTGGGTWADPDLQHVPFPR
ncbi:MAG: hypothetical protein IPH03_13030 [Tetrasphaera sp.]|nr:hypothetical protein [Tetrasphaera sp.]